MEMLAKIVKDKKDIVRAGNSVLGFKDYIGKQIKVGGVVIYKKEELDERTGELKEQIVSAIKMENGEFITSVSPTVRNSLGLILETYSEEEILNGELIVEIKTKKSNGGRDFIYLDLV